MVFACLLEFVMVIILFVRLFTVSFVIHVSVIIHIPLSLTHSVSIDENDIHKSRRGTVTWRSDVDDKNDGGKKEK